MTKSMDKTFVLAGDIGGTKTNLGLFLSGKGCPVPKAMETFSSQKAPDLEHIIGQFFEIHPVMEAFTNKGRFKGFLEKIPVKGSCKNNLTELAFRFGSGLADPNEQIHRNSGLFRGFWE